MPKKEASVKKKVDKLIEDHNKKVRESMSKVAKELFEDSFESAVKVAAVSWDQYTPYFNDGEACVFRGPYEIKLKFEGEDEFLSSEDWDYRDKASKPSEEEQMKEKSFKSFSWILKFEPKYLLAMFGDHACVTINKDLSIVVEKVDHD